MHDTKRYIQAWLGTWLALCLFAIQPQASLADALHTEVGVDNLDPDLQKLVQAESDTLAKLQVRKQEELARLADRPVPARNLEIAAVEVETEEVRLQSLALEVESVLRLRDESKLQIDVLRDKLAEFDKPRFVIDTGTLDLLRTTLSRTLGEKQEELRRSEQRLIVLAKLRKISEQKIELLRQWRKTLTERHEQYRAQVSQETLQERLQQLSQQKADFEELARQFKSQLSPQNTPLRQLLIQLDVLEAEQNANLIDLDIQLTRLKEDLRGLLQSAGGKTLTLAEFDPIERRADELAAQIQGMLEAAPRRIQLNASYASVTEKMPLEADFGEPQKRKALDRLQNLTNALNARLEQAGQLASELEKIRKDLAEARQAQLHEELNERHAWPSSLDDWKRVLRDLATSPLGAIIVGVTEITQKIREASWPRTTGALVLLTFWILGTAQLRDYMTRKLPPLDRTTTGFSVWTLVTVGYLIKHNLWTITVVLILTTSLRALRVPYEAYEPFVLVTLVFTIFKPAMTLNRLLFRQRFAGFEWYDRPLYEGLKWTLLLGFALISFSVLLHHLPVQRITTDTFDRFLQLGLVALSVVLLWRAPAITRFVGEMFAERPRTLLVLRLMIWLLPLGNLLTALIGIAGYINLSRYIAVFEGWFFLVLAVWMILRGYLIDFFQWLAPWVAQNVPNGVIWQEAVIKPLDRLSGLALLLLAVFTLFWLWGLAGDRTFLQHLYGIGQIELFQVGEARIRVINAVLAAALVAVFLWATRWSREIAYRWLFRRVADRGARNSLAVFTQYAVALVGGFTLLKALGIDMTALTVAAGAIGVGIGFGLQNIANNFVSGILLLIERPIRNGDIVDIKGYEGRVTRIGIRSLSVRTWDNMEVIIPNTETITQPFTNWTHQDSIVRTKLVIGAGTHSDPHEVRRIILDILHAHPAVEPRPVPNVYLTDFGDATLKFQAEYHVDVNRFSRINVKSEILFQIWDSFVAHGIEIPQRDMRLHVDKETMQEILPSLPAAAPTPPEHASHGPPDAHQGQENPQRG